MVTVVPAPSVDGIPVSMTPPVAGSYVAMTPAGRPLKITPESPGGRLIA